MNDDERAPRTAASWHAVEKGGETEYHWSDGAADAIAWQDHGQWHLSFSLDHGSPFVHQDLGRTGSVKVALERADKEIEAGYFQVAQNYNDIRNVINLANEVDDRDPEEQASLDRLTAAMDEPNRFNRADDERYFDRPAFDRHDENESGWER